MQQGKALVFAAIIATAVSAAEVYPRARATTVERLKNRDLEQRKGEFPTEWWPLAGGCQVAARGGVGGSTGLVCRRETREGEEQGALQAVPLNQERPCPLVVSAWSKAQDVDGEPDASYALHCDLRYTDGTALWLQFTPFRTGTHDWEKVKLIVLPDKPVQRARVQLVFGKHRGTVWFDDVGLVEEVLPPDAARLDGVSVEPRVVRRRGAGRDLTSGGLSVGLAGTDLDRVTLGGRDVTGRYPGGLLVRDVADERGGFHAFEQGVCPALGLSVELRAEAQGNRIDFAGTLRDTTGRERAVTLLFAVPLAAGDWRWGDDATSARPVGSAPELTNYVDVEAGAHGKGSKYPLANVSGTAGGVNLAIDPWLPGLFRYGHSAGTGLLWLAYDFGLTPRTGQFPSAAAFHFALFGSDSEWGFRAGLAAWQRAFPEAFAVRLPEQGPSLPAGRASRIADWQDFGFRFTESTEEVAWNDQRGILSFRYNEPGTWWMPIDKGKPRTAAVVDETLAAFLVHPTDQRRRRYAHAVATSAMLDAAGRPQYLFRDVPWCNGAVWSMNPSPWLAGDETQGKIIWGADRLAAYEPGAPGGELDGEFLDSIEMYVTAPCNFRAEHLAAARLPLTFDRATRRPCLYKVFSVAELAQKMSADLRARGRFLYTNSTPYRFGWLAAYFDVITTEADWFRGSVYRAEPDDIFNLRRAVMGKKPYLMTMNTNNATFGPYVERYLARCLAYGIFPTFFSQDAYTSRYWEHPEWYDRDRPLFKKYVPAIKAVAQEGWEPVTGARCDHPEIRVERYGPGRSGLVYFTLHNPTAKAASGKLTFDERVLGRAVPARPVTVEPYLTQVIGF